MSEKKKVPSDGLQLDLPLMKRDIRPRPPSRPSPEQAQVDLDVDAEALYAED